MSIDELISKYLDYLAGEKKFSKYTLKDYRYYLNYFKATSKTNDPAALKDITLIVKYRKAIHHFKKSTQNYFLISLRSFLIYLNSIGIDTINPQDIDLGEAQPQTTDVLENQATQKLLAVPDENTLEGLRDISIIWLLIKTGLKVSELASLDISHIDLENYNLQLLTARKLALSPDLADHLKRYLRLRKDPYKPLFIRFKGSVSSENFGEKMRLSSRSIERMVEKYTKQAGLSTKATPQILRHSYAANLIAKGEDLKTVQRRLGYKNPQSAKRYQQTTEKLAKKSTP